MGASARSAWAVTEDSRRQPAPRRQRLRCRAAALSDVASRPTKEVCRNRKAKFNFELLEKYECGIELQGTEVKSVRAGRVSLQEAFCRVLDGRVMLIGCNIAAHERANSYDNHDPLRKRQLLLHKKEILKLKQKQEEKGLTLVPLRMYFRGSWLKLEIALARGKNATDKRQTIKEREAKRDLQRITKLRF